ncbi:MAG: hypothetical protein V3U02_00330 [Calditrichia bacterium]
MITRSDTSMLGSTDIIDFRQYKGWAWLNFDSKILKLRAKYDTALAAITPLVIAGCLLWYQSAY